MTRFKWTVNDTITLPRLAETKPVKSCAVNGISTCWDNLAAEPKDKCKTALPETAKFMDSVQPTSTLDILQIVRGGHKYRAHSTLTLQLQNKFESLINLHETEVEMTAIRVAAHRKRKKVSWRIYDST